VILAIVLLDREIVDTGNPAAHQAMLVELPVLVAVGSEPVSAVVTALVGDLNPVLALGNTVYIWADTQFKGINDRAPNTESGDGCPKPEVANEVLSVILN